MGKRIEQELRDRLATFHAADQERQRNKEILIRDILKEIQAKEFTIVTASGLVIAGQAVEVNIERSWPFAPPMYIAKIQLRPKH